MLFRRPKSVVAAHGIAEAVYPQGPRAHCIKEDRRERGMAGQATAGGRSLDRT